MEWLTALGPPVAVGLILYFIINRMHKRIDDMHKRIDGMQTKEMAKHVEKGLEKELKENKSSLNKLFDKAEESHVAQAEMAKDIRWLVTETKNGSK